LWEAHLQARCEMGESRRAAAVEEETRFELAAKIVRTHLIRWLRVSDAGANERVVAQSSELRAVHRQNVGQRHACLSVVNHQQRATVHTVVIGQIKKLRQIVRVSPDQFSADAMPLLNQHLTGLTYPPLGPGFIRPAQEEWWPLVKLRQKLLFESRQDRHAIKVIVVDHEPRSR